MFIEALNLLLEQLFDHLKHEAIILSVDEEEEIKSLQREVQLIESYLRDMDEIQRQATLSHVQKTTLQHLMQDLSDIEDVLDNWIYQKVQQAHQNPSKKFKAFFNRTSDSLVHKGNLVKKVVELRERVGKTLQRPENYQLPNNYPQVAYTRRRPRTNPFLLEDEIIVGIEEDVETLVAKFLGKDGERESNSAIVGMGGSGKTTLAKMFYNHKEIKEAFPNRRAWVCVSQEWNAHDLLLQICAMLGVSLSEDEKLITHIKLQQFFEKGACLVVLDDVWEKNALQELFPTLLSGNSRVLITTRKEKIVKFPRIDAFYLHRARRLTPQQSWELFSRIVGNCCEVSISFEEGGEYVKLGKEMLEKCDGLPLAIITLAGILGTKGTIQQWESIKERVISAIMGDETEAVEKVLEFSYSDLPYAIKTCFLYLGTFKEDKEIWVSSLINLWIGEGFVKADPCDESQRLEEVAMNILEELVQRCMIQAIERRYDGSLITVRIHDLIRDLCINKANEHGMFQVLSSSTKTTHIKPSSYRAIIYDRKSFTLQNPRLRTLISIASRLHSNPIPKELFPFEKLKQLRVLCLRHVEVGDSAEHIGNMVLLRFLRLVDCYYQIENLYFIKKLRNLEILFITNVNCESVIPKLADNMCDCMEQLRVICLRGKKGFAKDPSPAMSGVANLKNIETLTQQPVCQGLVKEVEASRNHNLRVLELAKISSQPHLDAICVCVSNNLPHLEILWLHLDKPSGVGFDLQKMKWGRCQLLKEVWLEGKIIIKQHESWLCPPKLLSLILRKTEIEEEEDMNKFIAGLDHLRKLQLQYHAYMGDKLIMVGFPQLQTLNIFSLPNLKEWRITQGSLPKLRQLKFLGGWLESIPDGIIDNPNIQLDVSHWFLKRGRKKVL